MAPHFCLWNLIKTVGSMRHTWHSKNIAYRLLVGLLVGLLVISILGVAIVAAADSGDDLPGKYETSDKIFER